MLGSGKLGYGMAVRAWCVLMWRGPAWRSGRDPVRYVVVCCGMFRRLCLGEVR